ncbi:MAG: CSLREA domain-containing protein [Caldilineaceae bacterium]
MLHLGVNAAEPQTGITISVNTAEDELNSDGDCSLREAIESANRDSSVDACPPGSGVDTIIVPTGVYSLTLTGVNEDDNQTGDLDIRSDVIFSGVSLTETVLSGNEIDRVLHIHAGAQVTITGFTITDGHLPDAHTAITATNRAGGAIINWGVLTMRDSSVQNSRASDSFPYALPDEVGGDGGGIANYGQLTLIRTIVRDNLSGAPGWVIKGGSGGGIANFGVCTLNQSEVSHNIVPPLSSGRGGGIYNEGTLFLFQSALRENSSGSGIIFHGQASGGPGGGLMNVGVATLVSSTVSNNIAGRPSGDGGGIFNSGALTLTHSTISANRAAEGAAEDIGRSGPSIGGDGAGVYNAGQLFASNNTISGNICGDSISEIANGRGGHGGGIYNVGAITMTNTTITLNITGDSITTTIPGGDGGGIYNTGTVALKNSLIGHNVTHNMGPDCYGSLTSYGYNLLHQPAQCALLDNVDANIIGLDPRIGPLADNGGSTWTHALLFGSPAVDAGSCTDIDFQPVTTDQRGEVRPQNNNCDMGAFEAPLVVTHYNHLPLIIRTHE